MDRLRAWLGLLMNFLGVPGFVREGSYRANHVAAGVQVRVTRGRRFTVVSINELDVYFSRLSGRFDGIGFNPGAAYTPASARARAGSDEQPARSR
jgi:hypothetical protein